MRQKKSLGQVFLHDKNILNMILSEADKGASSTIVEVGVGEGILSEGLVGLCRSLVLYEIDPTYLSYVEGKLKDYSTVSYISGDILKETFEQVTSPNFKVVANIPYYISAKFMKLLITERSRLEFAVIMVQDEFAKKLIAEPGSDAYTSLSVYLSYYFDISYLFKVTKTCFKPVPKVDSAVVKLSPKKELPFAVKDDVFFNVVRSAFWGRRKTLLNCLLQGPYLSFSPDIKQLPFFEKRTRIRGEVLGLNDFHELYKQIIPYLNS
jgi:16S rRNA (adenine1518-N6/adenine1519-N6)-dimethyltransferase